MGNLQDELRKTQLVKTIHRSLTLESAYKGSIHSSVREHAEVVVKAGGYLTGGYAIDVAALAGLSCQSTAYPVGYSPNISPQALKYAPDEAYLDLDRLCWWDQWKVLWTRVGAHAYQDAVCT